MQRTIALLFVTMTLFGCETLKLGSNEELARELKVEQLLIKGEKLYRSGDLFNAKEAFKQVLELSPKEEQALYRLGNISFLEKDLVKSANYFVASISVNPKNSKAHYNLGTIYLMRAEEHMKFFAATAPEGADISRVSQLLADLAEFAGGGESQQTLGAERSNLDKLVNLIENN